MDSDSGYVRFVNRHSNKALDLWEWSTADGGRIVGYSDLNGVNQQWQMVQVGTGAPPPTTAPPPTGGCGSGTGEGEVTLSGSTWTARNGGTTRYTGGDMLAAMQAAVNGLTAGRTSKQRVVVRGSGNVSAASRLSLPSLHDPRGLRHHQRHRLRLG